MNGPTPDDFRAKVFADRRGTGEWRVERFNEDGETIEVAIFDGPQAHERARRYADREYGVFDEVELEPYARPQGAGRGDLYTVTFTGPQNQETEIGALDNFAAAEEAARKAGAVCPGQKDGPVYIYGVAGHEDDDDYAIWIECDLTNAPPDVVLALALRKLKQARDPRIMSQEPEYDRLEISIERREARALLAEIERLSALADEKNVA